MSFGRPLAAKCVYLNSQPCINRPALIDLNADELSYYLSVVSLDRCDKIYNTLDDLCDKIYVPNKTDDVNVKAFNMITRINESKRIIEHISFDCRCKFNSAKYNSKQKWNIYVNVSVKNN